MARLTKIVGVRVHPKDWELLKEIADRRGVDASDIVRQLIRTELAKAGYLDKRSMMALGVREEETDGHRAQTA